MNFVFFGFPAAGKGTQAKLLSERFSIPHISTGEIFRKNMEDETPLGVKIDKLMRAGNYVPDELTNEIVVTTVSGSDGWILDGYPRTIGQARLFNEYIQAKGLDVHFILVEINEEEVWKRSLQRRKEEGRFEDADDAVIQKRIDNYNQLTKPAVEYFGGGVIKINGKLNIEQVFNKILETIG